MDEQWGARAYPGAGVRCWHCRQEFEARSVKRPFVLWRVPATLFILLSVGDDPVLGDIGAPYCRGCRRRMNAWLLCMLFLVGIILLMAAMFSLALNRR